MKALSLHIGERPVGSEGNRKATKIFRDELEFFGWNTHIQEFNGVDCKNEEKESLNIPQFYMKQNASILKCTAKATTLTLNIESLYGKAYNVIGKKGDDNNKKIVIASHIDSNKSPSGAIDNSAGVVVLLLLADLLKDYSGDKQIEMVALNCENQYAVGKEKLLDNKISQKDDILLYINVDSPGYRFTDTSFSFYNVSKNKREKANKVLHEFPLIADAPELQEGSQCIFFKKGLPGITIKSKLFKDNQGIMHIAKDGLTGVDCSKLVDVSLALNSIIRSL